MTYDFSKNRKCSKIIIALSLIMIFVLALFPSLVSHAESSDVKLEEFYSFNISSMGISNFWNSSDFENSSLYNANAIIRDGANTSIFSELSLLLDGNDNNDELKLPQSFNISSVDYSLDDFPYFLITYDGSNWYYNVYLFDTISGVYNSFGSSSCDIVTSSDVTCVCFTFDSSCSLVNTSIKTPNNNWSGMSMYQLGGYCVSNFPICSIDSSKLNDTWLKSEVINGTIAYWYCLAGLPYQDTSDPVQPYEDDFGIYEELFIDNINYIITDCNSGNGYSNPITNESYGSEDTQEILNHMTLDDATTKMYLVNSSFNSGTLYIYAGTDEYQMEHKSDYSLRIVGSSTYNLSHNTNYYQQVKYNKKSLNNYFPVPNNSSLEYQFTLNSNDGSYYDIPLSYLSNNEYSISLKELNSNFSTNRVDNKLVVLASALDSTFLGESVWTSLVKSCGNVDFNFWKFDASKVSSNTYDFIPLGASYHFDMYLYNNQTDTLSSVQSIGDCDLVSGTYNFENVGTTTDEQRMSANGTDYVPSDYMSTNTNDSYGGSLSNNSGNSSASSSPSVSPSISGGDNSVNVNIENNPTFNNDSGSSGLLSGTLLATIISLISNNKTTTVSAITDISGADGYLDYMGSVFGFVPNTVWSTISLAFIACVGIAIIGFIISIVIRFIT